MNPYVRLLVEWSVGLSIIISKRVTLPCPYWGTYSFDEWIVRHTIFYFSSRRLDYMLLQSLQWFSACVGDKILYNLNHTSFNKYFVIKSFLRNNSSPSRIRIGFGKSIPPLSAKFWQYKKGQISLQACWENHC